MYLPVTPVMSKHRKSLNLLVAAAHPPPGPQAVQPKVEDVLLFSDLRTALSGSLTLTPPPAAHERVGPAPATRLSGEHGLRSTGEAAEGVPHPAGPS